MTLGLGWARRMEEVGGAGVRGGGFEWAEKEGAKTVGGRVGRMGWDGERKGAEGRSTRAAW